MAAENHLAELRLQREVKRDEQRVLIASKTDLNEKAQGRAINALAEEIRSLDAEIATARGAVRPLREPYGQAVARAMLPAQKEAAAKMLVALDEFAEAARFLNASQEQILAASGEPVVWLSAVAMPNLVDLYRAGQAILGEDA